jgi:SAM-dependent methyltransferase
MSHAEQRSFFEYIKKIYPEYFSNTKVLEVGSYDVNGNNKYLFDNCEYIGLDIGEGPNVDVVSLAHEYKAKSETFDIIISSSAFEHDMYINKTLKNIVRMLKQGGMFLFTCTTGNRSEHGTLRAEPSSSPLTTKISGWDEYYKNLDESDIRNILNIDNIFSDYEFSVIKDLDLRFYGIKYFKNEKKNEKIKTDKINSIIKDISSKLGMSYSSKYDNIINNEDNIIVYNLVEEFGKNEFNLYISGLLSKYKNVFCIIQHEDFPETQINNLKSISYWDNVISSCNDFFSNANLSNSFRNKLDNELLKYFNCFYCFNRR